MHSVILDIRRSLSNLVAKLSEQTMLASTEYSYCLQPLALIQAFESCSKPNSLRHFHQWNFGLVILVQLLSRVRSFLHLPSVIDSLVRRLSEAAFSL